MQKVPTVQTSRFCPLLPKASYQLLIRQIGYMDPKDSGNSPPAGATARLHQRTCLLGFSGQMKHSNYAFPLLIKQDSHLVLTEAKILETTSCGFVVPKARVCQDSRILFFLFPRDSSPRNRFVQKNLKKKKKCVLRKQMFLPLLISFLFPF